MSKREWAGFRNALLAVFIVGGILMLAGNSLADIGNPSYCQVFLYEHTNYGGATMSFMYDYDVADLTKWRLPNSSKSWNDRLSSLKLGKSVKIVLYEHINFKGKSITLQANGSAQKNYPSLHSFGWGDKASSFKVRMCDYAN